MRFESVNYRTRVWLNGREIGRNTGAYIPFQLRLKGLQASAASTGSSCASTRAACRPTSRRRA